MFQGQDPLAPKEEQRLVANLLMGDEESIRELYSRFGRPVYTLGLRLLGTTEAAEELTQDVFLTAWRKVVEHLLDHGLRKLFQRLACPCTTRTQARMAE